MRQAIIAIGLTMAAFAAVPALAQGVSEATGSVVDRDDNPIQGAVVTFFAKSKPDVPYTAKTNKKGRYFVSGMFTAKEDEMWGMSVEAEGFVPVHVRVESRNVNKVLVGDIMEAKLSPGKRAPEIIIRPLGKAQVDWVVAPKSEVEEEMQAMAVAVPVDPSDPEAAEAAEAVEPAKDPWVEALTLASNGALEDSVAFFDEAVSESPEDAERHEVYAKVLYRLERLDQAEAQARKAVELDPSRTDSQMVLYSLYESSGDLEQARVVLETALESVPEDTRILDRLGYIAGELGDAEAAEASYRRITEIQPNNAEAWLVLANLLADAGRLEESEQAYQKVVDLDPQNAYQTYYNLGALIIKRSDRSEGDTRRAIEAFRRALDIKPDYSKACQELAFALIGIGDQQGALQTLQAYVNANPNGPDTGQMKALIKTLQK